MQMIAQCRFYILLHKKVENNNNLFLFLYAIGL